LEHLLAVLWTNLLRTCSTLRWEGEQAVVWGDSADNVSEPTIREPEDIRRDCAQKLRAVQVSEHFQAILGCLLGEDWTTPRLD
jgi:2-keto-4-pentenoate hydratase/2-oxohepta-3-ene-1,7-dioic acid hydratase in catechol pathway